jgi:SAM-dependent MidA family methyltransferase
MLEALRATSLATTVRYQPVEIDGRRVARIRERLALEGLADGLAPIDDGTFDGIVIANEVLDALPVHRVRIRDGSLRELAVDVGRDGAFVEVEIAPTTAALAERLAAEGIALVEGQTAELCLALDAWIAAAAAPLRRGLLLLIDYGAPASELYDARRRPDGTLRAYVRHRVHADAFRHVGRQDLTAHVDVTAVERAAHAAGLTTVGITTQTEALIGLGAEDRLRAVQADPSTTLERYAGLRSALVRLLDPAAMGRFAVMGFGRAWPDRGDPLGLFAFRTRRPGGRPY